MEEHKTTEGHGLAGMEHLVSSPYVLILIFGVGGLFGLMYILLGHAAMPAGTTGRIPHGPREYPEVFDKEDPLAGLPKDPKAASEVQYPHDPPPWSRPDIFPCSSCHSPDDEVKTAPHKLKNEHKEIVLEHGGENRWCFDCHNPQDRDKLRLANGTLVSFEESYRLCGQCHGENYRDWRDGIHGRRTGYWDGPKRYRLCAHCHNPHSPKFKPLAPLPPPVRPEFLKDNKRAFSRTNP